MDVLQETSINGRWTLNLPEHRAARPQWGAWTDPATGQDKFGWEVERLDSMSKNIGPGDFVFDVGTEEGDISALIQTWIGHGDGGICLFEPNERVWSNIRAIWDGNHLPKPLGFWYGFASDMNNALDQVDVLNWPDSSLGPLISDHGFCNLAERPDIPAIRIDDFTQLVGYTPDVITMDVEGAEFNVILGAVETLSLAKPLVYVSVHPQFMWDMYHYEAALLHEFMGGLGYRVKHLATDHEEHWVWFHPLGREFKF